MMGTSRRQERAGGALDGKNYSNVNNKVNDIVLDYNPKYKINISESILI